ncbi:hypothetical protein SteCoe_8146 [Stentor coeruleus]|uniref:B box-type domain-containing protein n=1 Tax=Stentor coeruleus TaxID=5963 RepID=A0A1R2CKQ7_9CILI|nr:hypothetical protein SteCoe_8146 [Stentor coeruleus]
MDIFIELKCICCEQAFIPSHSTDFILKCTHFRCGPCSGYERRCPLDNICQMYSIPSLDSEKDFEAFKGSLQLACNLHKNDLECYCKTCNEAICYKCVLYHKEHEILEEHEMEDIEDDVEREIQEAKWSTWKRHSSTSLAYKRIHTKLFEINSEYQKFGEYCRQNCLEKIDYAKWILDYERDIFESINNTKFNDIITQFDMNYEILNLFENIIKVADRKKKLVSELTTNLLVLLNKKLLELPDLSLVIKDPSDVKAAHYSLLDDYISLEEHRYFYYKIHGK